MGVGMPDGVTRLTRMTTRTMATTSEASSTGGLSPLQGLRGQVARQVVLEDRPEGGHELLAGGVGEAGDADDVPREGQPGDLGGGERGPQLGLLATEVVGQRAEQALHEEVAHPHGRRLLGGRGAQQPGHRPARLGRLEHPDGERREPEADPLPPGASRAGMTSSGSKGSSTTAMNRSCLLPK